MKQPDKNDRELFVDGSGKIWTLPRDFQLTSKTSNRKV